MDEMRIKLSAIWIALMLTYLLGDVLRIFSGSFEAGRVDGKPMSQGMWFGISVIMLLPILMIVLSLILPQPVSRWANIIVAAFLVLFNLAGLPYSQAFDNFLMIVGFAFNALSIWFAVTWT